MGSLKDDWKETGKDLGGAFKQLGKSLVKSGKKVVNTVDEWSESEDDEEAAAKAKPAYSVICSKCGTEITDPEAVFCLKCGEKLTKPAG